MRGVFRSSGGAFSAIMLFRRKSFLKIIKEIFAAECKFSKETMGFFAKTSAAFSCNIIHKKVHLRCLTESSILLYIFVWKFSEKFLKSFISEDMKKAATAIWTKRNNSQKNFLVLSTINRKILAMIPRMQVFAKVFWKLKTSLICLCDISLLHWTCYFQEF